MVHYRFTLYFTSSFFFSPAGPEEKAKGWIPWVSESHHKMLDMPGKVLWESSPAVDEGPRNDGGDSDQSCSNSSGGWHEEYNGTVSTQE